MSKFLAKIFGSVGKDQVSTSTKLFTAYQNNNLPMLSEVIKSLGDSEPQKFLECKHEDFTLLHKAISDKNEEVVQIIRQDLPYFKDIVDDASNEKGMTPLNLAAQVSSLNIAKILVSSGASVMKTDAHGNSILHYAAVNNDVRMMDFALR
jgi:ankyrin repeat protein